jgi:hypothetical protein
MHLTDVKRRTFDALIETVRGHDCKRATTYQCPYPKYEFLNYLVEELGYLLHGSREVDITMFEPRLASDLYSFSAQRAVYAASDGIWPMVFAILDRRRQLGMFSNGCSRVLHSDGTRSEPTITSLWLRRGFATDRGPVARSMCCRETRLSLTRWGTSTD